MNATLPSSICFYSEDHANDDCSEITEPQVVTAYPCPDRYARTSSRREGLPFMTAEQQEIFELKQKLAEKQDMINALTSKLNQCQLEKEELEAEKAVLIEERTDQQMPADAQHAKLKRENARLQVISDVMHKSFKKSSEDARRKSESDKQTIKALKQENKKLQYEVLRFSQVNVNRDINESGYSGNSSQEANMLKPQLERQLSRKLSRRETELSKSNNTAPTHLMSHCDQESYVDQEADEFQDWNVDENGNGTVEEKNNDKDIDAEELKHVFPWLKWAVKARVSTPRAA